jgi:hypothetical protein
MTHHDETPETKARSLISDPAVAYSAFWLGFAAGALTAFVMSAFALG